jgi:hypothetical protein
MKGDESEDAEPGPITWDIHSRAMTGLLRLRGRQQFRSKQGCQIFQLAYHTIVRQSAAIYVLRHSYPHADYL